MINTDKYLPVQLPTTGLHSMGKLLVRTGKTGTDVDGAGKGYFGVDYVLSLPKTAKTSSSKTSSIWTGIKAFFGFGQSSTKKLENSSVQWVKVNVQDDKNPNLVATVFINVAQINGTDRRAKKQVKPEPEIAAEPAPVASPKPHPVVQTSQEIEESVRRKWSPILVEFYDKYMEPLREISNSYHDNGIQPNSKELSKLLANCQRDYNRLHLNYKTRLEAHGLHQEYLNLVDACKNILK